MVEPFSKKDEEENPGKGIYIRRPRKDHFEIHKTNFTAVSLVLAIMLFLFLLSKFMNPEYTSYIDQGSNKIDIGENFYKGSILYLSSKNKELVPIKSVKLSGKIIGEGNVSVYLVAENAVWLVYSNKGESFEIPKITGFAIEDMRNIQEESSGQEGSVQYSVIVNDIDENGFELSSTEQGFTQKRKYIDASPMVFEPGSNIEALELDIIEDPLYKEAFDRAEKSKVIEVGNGCKETCMLERSIKSDIYMIKFDMGEGMAFNLTSLEIY